MLEEQVSIAAKHASLRTLVIYQEGNKMSSGQVPEKPFGNKVLAEGSNPTVEYATFAPCFIVYLFFDHSIVAIHGLNGHREETWTKDNVNWLRHLLPTDIPNARILSWGYDANIHSTSSQKSRQFLNNHTLGLLSDLCLKRRLTKVQTLYQGYL